MEYNSLGCQVCLTKFNRVHQFKKHVRSMAHQQTMKEVFQKDMYMGRGFFPFIIGMQQVPTKQPIIGLSLLTMCFSPEADRSFYLCHVCEEMCPPAKISRHLSSGDHCSNYFSYTDPNVLNFSWVPSKDMRGILRPERTKKVSEKRQLQMLDLPKDLLKKLETSTYSEVMHTLSENDTLLKLLEAVKPKRTMIQTYQRDSNRKHPLLGIQHLIELICAGPTEKRYYLCTLCRLTLATRMIIKHVLSFDHVFRYFKVWHPSTLLSKETYKDYTKSFASMILDFAKQTEEIHGTANTDMKQVSLDPDKFTSLNFSCYAEALKELESITKENKESSLITSIKPGNKLECRTVTAGSHKLRCQDCSVIFDTVFQYYKHVSTWNHKQMVKKLFGEAERADGYDQTGWNPSLELYKYVKQSLKQNEPAIGVSLVVTCVSTQVQVEHIYVCFACHDCFPESFLKQHLNSRKHLIHTLLYQNPWRLPFAWENRLDVKVLRSMAWEEEKERGPDQMMLKVLDIPYWIFWSLLPPSYPKVMERLALHRTLLKREVPQCETYSKLKQNESFPLLGNQFLVMHDLCVTQHQSEVGCLCLLCGRTLSGNEYYTHVFSREHVASFLDRFHPGSLNSSTDAETLLDLAKQAAGIHSISHVQVIKLDNPIWKPCTYNKAISILASAKKRDGKGELEPRIMPEKKLVPRETLKDADKDHVRDNSQKNSRMMEGSEKKTSQTSTDNTETTLKKISVEVVAEITNTHRVESGENAEKGADKEPPTPSEKQSEKRREVFSNTSSEDIKNAGSETCQVIKEKIEAPTARRPSGETLESCQNTDKNDGTETGEERSKSNKDVLTKSGNNMYKEKERQRASSMSEKSDACPNEDVEKEMGHKRQQLTSKQDASCEEPQNKGESAKPSHETAKDKVSSNTNHQQLWQYVQRKGQEPVVGLSALLECRCDQRDPIYLCECCSLKIPEKDVISHVSGVDHQKMYLVVVDLGEEIYSNISKQNFKSAIETVRALQSQQDSWRELPSTSALSGVQPVDTSVTLHAQHEVNYVMDKFQVVEMEIDDDDSEAQPSSATAAVSVMTETTSKTTEVPPKSNEDVKMTHNNCLSKTSEDTSSIHVSTSGTNTNRLHPDSTGSNSKAKIISNTTVSPFKTATTSKIVGTSQTTATLDSTVTTPTKSMTAISKCTAKSSNSTPGTTKSTAPMSNLPKNKNTSKNSETASKTTFASQTMVTSVATAKMSKKSVEVVNHEAPAKPVHMKNSVASNADVSPNIPKSNAPAAPHLTMLRSENKNPPTEPPHASASKTKPRKSLPEVGLQQMIVVSCEEKRQVYCELCSVRCEQSSHTVSFNHKYNYVKMKFPGWIAKRSELERKLDKIVAHLAQAEKDVGSRSIQRIKVKIDLYKELRDLPGDKAIERVKAMMRQRDLQVSSSSTADAPEVLRQQVAFVSPIEASSPDDGMYMPQNEMAGVSSDNRSEQESGCELQTLLVQMPENESISKEEGNLAPGQSDRAQSLKGKGPEANDLISHQLHSCPTENDPEPIATPAIQVADITESTGRFAQTPDTHQETPEKRHQQERGDPELQDTRTTSPKKFFNPDPLSAASVNTEQQNQSRPSRKAENVPQHPGCSPGPGYHSASQALPMISIGERTQGCSHLSRYLRVKGLDTEPIIGLGSVWECRGMSLKPCSETFFLCESCRKTLYLNNICQHMVSDEHQLKYMLMQYPQFLSFWTEKDLLPQMKLELLRGIAQRLSVRERFNKMDAQGILLGQELYACVRAAPFSEALKMVQNIKKEQKLSVYCLPISTLQQKDQHPEDWQRREESLPTEMQSAQSLETDQISNNEARQKTEKQHLEETAMVGDLDGVKQRSVLSPLDVISVSSEPDSVVSPFPQETCRSLSVQPELRPSVSQHQRIIPELQLKQAEVHSESTSSLVSPKTSQTMSVSLRDECLPTRKRPAVTSIETLVRPCTDNPQLEDPLPAKSARTCSELQPIGQPSPKSASESTPLNPPAASTLLPPKDKDTGPGSDEQDSSTVDWIRFAHLMDLVRERRSTINMLPCMSAPDNAETATSYTSSSKSGVEMAKKENRWDSEYELVKATVRKNPPSTNSLEVMFSTAAPVVLGCENQLVTPNANSAFSANNSSLEGYLTRGNLLFRAKEANAVGTLLPSASTADPSDPQHQRSGSDQSIFGDVSQFNPSPFYCVATNHNPGQIPQPRGNTETDSTGVCQLPFNAIITARPDTPNRQFMDGYNGQDHTEVDKGNRVAHSFSTVGTVSPSDTLAASGGYGQYSQMAYVTNGHSGYLSSEAAAGSITPDNPPVYTGSLYQREGYTTSGLYLSQIYPEQEAKRFSLQSFGHSLTTPMPPEWVRLEMQQQQLMQQQYSSWTSAALAAGNGKVTNEAAHLGAVPFTTPANSSQRLIDMNEYSRNIIVPTQNSNNIITLNSPQVYVNPAVIHYLPTASSESYPRHLQTPFLPLAEGFLL